LKNNIFSKFFGTKNKTLDMTAIRNDIMGWHESGTVNTLLHLHDNQYENGYSSIQAITNQFMMVKPFAIDSKGKELKQTNVTNVLAAPNKSMSGMKFREALAIMSLVHNKVYIRVWHSGNRITENNITGFTFMEGVQEIPTSDGQGVIYQTPQGESLTEDEVIELKNVNPYDLTRGYSVASAARKWATLDDYIAAYQTGFFENGAVPAGQFVISAPTPQEYEDIVRNLKAKHRGASKNNNIVYDYAPVDPLTGKPMASSITWVPFNTTNKDLALQEIFNQVAKKIDSAYGVPPSQRGDNSNNTYASVRVDQEIFINNCIRPFATKIWTQFTHELNNITGGLGYLLAVDVETPHIAEEEVAFATAQSTYTSTLLSLLTAGYTLESAIIALELDESFLSLKEAVKVAPVVAPIVDVPEVTPTDQVDTTPDDLATAETNAKKALDPLSVNCKHCGRYLFKATGTTVVEDMPCPKCKATNNFKIINPLGNDVTHEFTFTEQEPKDIKMVAMSKQMSDADKSLITDKIAKVIRNQMERQIERVDVKSKALAPVDAGDAELYAKEILAIVTPLITSEGMKQYLMARLIDGIDGATLSTFSLDTKQIAQYTTYLTNVAKGYAEDTQTQIKSVLEDGISNKLPIQDVKKNLSNVMNTDEYRVTRMALSETNRAGNSGSIYAMEQVGKDTGLKIEKVWQTRDNACEYCKALNGTSVGISDDFVPKGETITGADGGTMVNDFGHMDVPTAHPNCGCYTTYKVIKD